MFERAPNYPIAVTAASGADRTAVRLAVEWLRNTTADVGGQPLVYVPNRPSLREWPILANLDGWAVVATWKSFGGWSGGAVLAAWPDAKHLALIADDDRTRALCVVPWNESEVAPWIRAYHPVTLPPTLTVAKRQPEIISDPVAVEGLHDLTAIVNVQSLYSSAGDRDRAVAVLLALHDGGHDVVPEDTGAWAMAHGWSAEAALELADLAEQIVAGKRLRTKRRVLRSDILDRWRRAAQE
ncbi:MAG TPA: hypothetical protein VI094_22505 [Propionibacteriaceae bacterium]